MRKLLLAVTMLMFSTVVYADCKENALQGEWTVFYRDNAFPTSVLAPDWMINIHYQDDLDEYSVELTDPRWKAWSGAWTHECVDGQTVLIGAIERRGGSASLVIEMSRVIDVDDLLPLPSGEIKLNQVNIHFPEQFSSEVPEELRESLFRSGYLASHPGHAHSYD